MSDKNAFGGGNNKSLYIPMSDTEQEVLERLVSSQDIEVHVVGWGVVNRPRVSFGDLRLKIEFNLTFNRPETPMPVSYLDLELRTRSGLLLFKQQYPTVYGGNPILVAAGVTIGMVWDIAIKDMDPALVKAIKPGAVGLTTAEGNRRLTPEKARLERLIRAGEARVKADATQKVVDVTRKTRP